jgi:hypothetical protein
VVFSEAPGGRLDLQPHFILDLKQDPARIDCLKGSGGLPGDEKAPTLSYGKGPGLSIFLGEETDRRWYLWVLGTTTEKPPEGRARETLLFLAGECAGLLFYRDLG